MTAVAEVATPSVMELEKELADLQAIIAHNEKELARITAVNLGNKGPRLRNLLDQIYALYYV